MRIFILIVIVVIFSTTLIGQDTTSENQNHYFPHHLGDKWFYDVYGDDVYQWITEIIQDTIINNESVIQTKILYNGNTLYQTYYIDSLDNVYSYNLEQNNPEYKLNADPGEIWLYYDIEGAWEYIRADSITTGYLLGIPTTFRSYTYLLAYDTTDTASWIEYMTDRLAYGFGIVNTGGEGVAHYIQGAIIDGIAYGDTSELKIAHENLIILPNISIVNYPNPFNNFTQLVLTLPQNSNYDIKLYDLKGQEIQSIWESHYHQSGKFLIRINGIDNNGKELSSGLYHLLVQNDKYAQTHKITYLK